MSYQPPHIKANEMNEHHFEIDMPSAGTEVGSIKMNGERLDHVRSFTIRAEVNKLSNVVLELLAAPTIDMIAHLEARLALTDDEAVEMFRGLFDEAAFVFGSLDDSIEEVLQANCVDDHKKALFCKRLVELMVQRNKPAKTGGDNGEEETY